jgi:NADH-quinone oxidoreductase subunit M
MDIITLSLIVLFSGAGLGILIKKYSGWISTLTITVSFLMLISHGLGFFEKYVWVQPLGLSFEVLLDKLSFPISAIILLVSTLASYFSIDYMKGRKNVHLYFACLILFAAGMYGVVLSANFIQFYIFWELMIIPAYFLIAYWGYGKASRIALIFFVFMHVGALLILFGILWLYSQVGTFDILELIQSTIPLSIAEGVSLLFLIGFGIKMAIFPLHGWLPDAHSEAPSPVSAMLSGLMISVGAYAIARIVLPLLSFLLVDYGLWLRSLALITMFYGGLIALAQTDIKRLFAYSSISQMGYVFFGLFLFNTVGYVGSIFHVINHAIVKSLLFFISGVIIHSTTVRDMRKLGGLLKYMPVTTFAALLAALSLSGIPLLNIFISEWMIFQGGIQSGNIISTSLAIGISLLTVGYSLWMIKRVFFGKKHPGLRIKPPTIKMKITMITLSVMIILFGIIPGPIIDMLM